MAHAFLYIENTFVQIRLRSEGAPKKKGCYSHPYYQIFFGRIPWSIPFLTHFRPHSCDTYTGMYPVSNLRVKSQIFKLRLFDIFKKHIRLKKNSATTKLFLFFVIILSTTTFQTLRNKIS